MAAKNSTVRNNSGASDSVPQDWSIRMFAFRYFLTISAASISETVTYPLDLTKTRLQVQKASATSDGVKYRGMFATAFAVVKEEGVTKLWSGLPPAVYRHIIYSGVRIMTYERFRSFLGVNADGSTQLWKSIVAGMSAGAFGQLLASPADLVKVQMQTEGVRRLSGQPARIRSTTQAFQLLYKEGGITGMWRGWLPNCQRAALVNLGELATYDQAKRALIRNTSLTDNYVTHSFASAASGLVAALIGTPADVVKTRIMNQPMSQHDGSPALYRGALHCLQKTVTEEGVLALWKGFFPIWTRMAPWSLTFWVSYEKLRSLTGVQSF